MNIGKMEEECPSSTRIVFFTLEALGHIHPIQSIAMELMKRGYDVRLLTMEKLPFADKIENLGIKTDYCIERDQNAIKKGNPRHFEFLKSSPKETFQSVYCIGGALDQKIDAFRLYGHRIQHKLRTMNPDCIICDHIVGCPFVTTCAKKWIRLYSAFPSILHSSFHKLFPAGLGINPKDSTKELKKYEIETKSNVLAKVKELFRMNGANVWENEIDMAPTSEYLNFYLGPKELGYENDSGLFEPLPEYWYRLEHTIVVDDNCRPFQVPSKLKNLPGKLIYFSLGTLANCDFALISRLIDIFSKCPHRFILSLGPHAKELPIHSNIYGEEFIDQKSVLQTVELFITHGGHNSIIEAFYFGVPMIVSPIFADQFDAAQRIQDCQYGYRIDALKSSEEEILLTIEKVFDNQELKKKYQKVSERLQSVRYDIMAADKIESILNISPNL